MEVPVPVLLGLVGLAGAGLFVAIRHRRLGADCRRLDASSRQLHRERQERDEDLADLRLEVGQLRHVLHDSQRRWGWSWRDFPLVANLAGAPDGEASRWLLAHAPGDWGFLPDGGEPSDRLAIQPFTGWRPPKLNGNGRRRRVQATGARGD